MMNIRIIIADDHEIMREGLRNLINKQPGMEVIAEAEDGRMAVELVRELSPDVVIMDIAMPILNGIEATRQIMTESVHTKIIALSMHSDRRFLANMLGAGASGYLLKNCAFKELIYAIQSVMSNQIYLSPAIVSIVIDDYVHHLSSADASNQSVLTPREREVLQLLAEGKTTKEIASCLNVSVTTIDTHRKNIMEKLGYHNIADLIKFAIREGITFLDT
jgi:DNA-binding NarL/FixJ family response regulator